MRDGDIGVLLQNHTDKIFYVNSDYLDGLFIISHAKTLIAS
jgi:hypothetical protein